MNNVRLQLVGGPYDGHTWFPDHSLILSEYCNEVPPPWAEDNPEMNFVTVEIGAHPTSGKFITDDAVVIRGDLGDAEYWWAEHDRWEHSRLWLWLEDGDDSVQDWDDWIDDNPPI